MVQFKQTIQDVEEELVQVTKLYENSRDRSIALLERIKDLNFQINLLRENLSACKKENR